LSQWTRNLALFRHFGVRPMLSHFERASFAPPNLIRLPGITKRGSCKCRSIFYPPPPFPPQRIFSNPTVSVTCVSPMKSFQNSFPRRFFSPSDLGYGFSVSLFRQARKSPPHFFADGYSHGHRDGYSHAFPLFILFSFPRAISLFLSLRVRSSICYQVASQFPPCQDSDDCLSPWSPIE